MADVPLFVEDTIGSWKQIARDYVEDIGAWREQPAERVYYDRWRPVPDQFPHDTTALIGWINAHYASVDPSPLHLVYKAVSSWDREHNADGIPDQTVLEGALEESLVVLTSIEYEGDENRRESRRHEAAASHWQLDAGCASYGGQRYDVNQQAMKLLHAFVHTDKQSLGYNDLRPILDEECLIENPTIRSHLKTLRNRLREIARDACLDEEIIKDPLPFKNGGWQFLLPRP